MKTHRTILAAFALCLAAFSFNAVAQNSAPAPGNPDIPVGGPGPVIGGSGLNGPAFNNPGPPPGPGPVATPPPVPVPGPGLFVPINTVGNPNWQNSGVINVVACGYDAQGVWRTIPLRVAYTYNGSQYDVNVLAAWNPWTDSWNQDVDVPAFNTTYFLNGVTYNFYTNLSTGTFYFNL